MKNLDNHKVAGLYYAYGALDTGAHPNLNSDDAMAFAEAYAAMRNAGGHADSVQDSWRNYVREHAG